VVFDNTDGFGYCSVVELYLDNIVYQTSIHSDGKPMGEVQVRHYVSGNTHTLRTTAYQNWNSRQKAYVCAFIRRKLNNLEDRLRNEGYNLSGLICRD
jgi:hypothetical protein